MPVSRGRAFQVVLRDVPGAWDVPGGYLCKPSVLSSLCFPGQWSLKHLLTLQGHMHSFAGFAPSWLGDGYFPLSLLLMWMMGELSPCKRREEVLNPSQPYLGWQVASEERTKGTLAVTATSGFRSEAIVWTNLFSVFLKADDGTKIC